MDYQVWIKDDFEGWTRVDCGDKEAAMREIDKGVRGGHDPLLTVEIPYKLNIKLEEDKIGEGRKTRIRQAKPEEPKKEEPKSEADQG